MLRPLPASRSLRALSILALLVALAGGAGAEEEKAAAPFPADGLMPKAEIGADRFLEVHPTYDGRGITVAVFDTGVDPGAPGLQTTTDGKPKIVDLVDGSGSGDVDTSAVRKAQGGVLEGLSGRRLALGDLKCPTQTWHVGLKPAYELFPRGLVRRLTEKRRKAWDESQRAVRVALERALADAEASVEKEARALARDLERRLRQLDALQKGYEDPGPLYDCVVFHDGSRWRAVVDTDEDGDLADEKAMASYRVAQEWATFSAESRLNFGVNVYDEGKRLSIVADCGAHGTHVAGIVAAHHPDRPELNGIAPGAQIVAVKIGDTRMGSSSMGTGEERGLVAALQNGCQLINMSYGGPTATPDRTRMERLYSEIVNEHGIIFVSSAGNEGPALSTVAAPGGTCSAIFGVGAYVSPAMMRAQYALREDVPPTHFTWSSRGPTSDGALGVDFSAPGAAVAPVPNWSLQGSTQMNGTSMASPSLCGAVALLLSGLTQRKETWSPQRVRRALTATARDVEGVEPFALGHGLVQVPEAFEHLVRWRDRPEEDARFEVRLPGREEARGLYLREPHETDRVCVERVQVRPHFREGEDHATRIALSLRLRLEVTQPWIEVPPYLALQHGGARFEVRVDPRSLPVGQVHFGEILAVDAEAPERGALVRVPVTVVRPQPVEDGAWKESVALVPGRVARRFFVVPAGATWADLRVRTVEADATRLLVVQAQQLRPGRHFKEDAFGDYMAMEPHAHTARSFAVTGGRTLELALAQYWSSLGAGTFEIELAFHGIRPESAAVHVDGADLVTQLEVEVPFGRERLAPRAEADTLRRRLRPTSFTLRPGEAERDLLPRGRLIHEAVLGYTIELSEGARVQPTSFQGIYEDVYESWSSALWMIFDANKRRLGTGPIWGKRTLKLEKGRYELRLHLRHEDPKRLEAVRDAVLYLDVKLDAPVGLPIFATAEALLAGGPRFEARDLQAGDRVRLHLGAPARSAVPKLAEAGDLLLGRMHYGAQDEARFGSGRRPGGWPLSVHVPPVPSKPAAPEGGASAKPPTPTLSEAVRDLKVARLAELRRSKNGKAFETLAREILGEHSGYLPVLVERLAWARGEGPPYADRSAAARVIAAAQEVIERVDTLRLAAHLGRKDEPDSAAERAVDARMRMRHDALVGALVDKALAESEGGASTRKAFESTCQELERWADLEQERFLELRVRRERLGDRLGAALETVRQHLGRKPTDRRGHELQLEVLEALGWEHWAAHERAWLALRFPSGYPPF